MAATTSLLTVEVAVAALRQLGRPTTAELASLTPLVLASAQTVAQLLKDERLLSADEAGRTMTALDVALDELSKEWGIDISG